MITVLLAAARAIALKLIAAMASQAFLEWAFFWVADLVVTSTKTNKDDVWLAKIKEAYKSQV